MVTGRLDEQAVGTSTACEPLDPDDLFHSLQNERRRRVLRVLTDAEDETFAMGEIAKFVAAAENECPERLVSSDQRKRVYIALYQNHLPQLDDVGLVEYDQSRGDVAAGAALDQAATFLEMTAPADDHDERDGEGGDERVLEGNDERTQEGNDEDVVGRFEDPLRSVASGGVAAVALLATGTAWGGVLSATNALAAVLAVAVAAFVFSVAVSVQ
jgi:hypothetical protein